MPGTYGYANCRWQMGVKAADENKVVIQLKFRCEDSP